MIYYAVLALLTLIALSNSGRQLTSLYWTVLVVLYIFSAFRHEVGCDWPNYMLNYRSAQILSYSEAAQQNNPSHWLLLKTMSVLGLGYEWLNIITSAIFFFGFHAISRRSHAPMVMLALSFPLLIINMPMSAVKQAAAIGLVCYAFVAFMDKRPKAFIIKLLFATSFHTSAAIFLLFLPFVRGKFGWKRIVASIFFAIPFISIISASETAELVQSRYIEGNIVSGGAIFRGGLLIATGIFYFVFLFKRWRHVFPKSHTFMSISALGMIMLAGLFPLSTVLADRFGYYFMVPQFFMFANMPFLFSRNSVKLMKIAPFAVLVVLFLSWSLLSIHYAQCYDPYSIGLPGSALM